MISKRFVLKRLLLLVPVVFGVATLVFAILHLSPGNPAVVIAGERASPEAIERIERSLGLNQPIWIQYIDFLVSVLQLDLGESFVLYRGEPVAEILASRLPVTLELALLGQFIGITLGIPIGIISAVKQDSLTDHFARITSLTGISVPIFWSGPILILLFATMLDVLPTSGRISYGLAYNTYTGFITVDTLIWGFLYGEFQPFISAVRHMILPAFVIGVYSMALISRMMRSSMLEVVRQDYIRTAHAKGQGAKITVLKHGLRNALIPVITVVGIQFGGLLGGAVLTEEVFNIAGIGTLLVSAILSTDYPVVQGTVLVFALLFTLVNLGVDILYSYLDPRIQQ